MEIGGWENIVGGLIGVAFLGCVGWRVWCELASRFQQGGIRGWGFFDEAELE